MTQHKLPRGSGWHWGMMSHLGLGKINSSLRCRWVQRHEGAERDRGGAVSTSADGWQCSRTQQQEVRVGRSRWPIARALPKNLDFPLQADRSMEEVAAETKMVRFRF